MMRCSFSGARLGPLVPLTLNASACQNTLGKSKLDWPAQSPNIYPIKHLWDELERSLRVRPCPTSVCDVTSVLLKEWSKIPINTLLNLVDSFFQKS